MIILLRMGDSDYRPRLFIGGLKGPVDKEELTQAFTEFGNIVDVWVAYDPPGFAFVEYDNMDSAKAAKEQMHLADLFDTQIRYVLKTPADFWLEILVCDCLKKTLFVRK